MKLYIVQKYIFAATIEDVLKIEKGVRPDEVYIDDNWRMNQDRHPEAIGYNKRPRLKKTRPAPKSKPKPVAKARG